MIERGTKEPVAGRRERRTRRQAARDRSRPGRFFRWLLLAAGLGLVGYGLVALALWKLVT